MRHIKFAQLNLATPNIINKVYDVLDTGIFVNGPYGQQFATAWADKCQAGYGVLTANGSAAIRAALYAARLPNRKHVIIPALSFAATAAAVYHSGLIPVYCDVTEDGLMDWDMCRDYLKTMDTSVAAIMPVHLYGQILDVPQDIVQLSLVIEDACQAHGVYTLTNSYIACFSFYPSKNLGAAGDAGAVVTNLSGVARTIQAFINYGDYPGEKYVHSVVGDNLRCDELQAAILIEQLDALDSNNAKRQAQANTYHTSGVASLATAKLNAWHLYPIVAEEPERLRLAMAAVGVDTGRHYPYVLPHIVNGIVHYKTPRADYISRHVVTLPIGPHLDENDASYVASILTGLARLNKSGKWELI